MTPILNLGDIQIDLSSSRWRSQGWRCSVSASSGGGKSNLVTVMFEELDRIGQRMLLIDPDIGEHQALAALPGVTVMTTDTHPDRDWIEKAIAIVSRGGAVVADLHRLAPHDQRVAYTHLLRELWRAQGNRPEAMFLFVEEAHLFAPQKRQNDPDSLEITVDIARRGRKRGINWIMASQRPDDLEKDVLTQSNVQWIGYLTHRRDFEAVQSLLDTGVTEPAPVRGRKRPPGLAGPELVGRRVSHEDVLSLEVGQFYLAGNGKVYKVQVRARQVPDLAATPPIVYRQRELWEANGKCT